MIPTEPVQQWRGEAATLRAHGITVLRGLGVPPSTAPGLLASAISPVGRDPLSPALNAGLRTLFAAVHGRSPAEAALAGTSLTGLGEGSTPLGDDYLLGAILGVWALGEAVGFDSVRRAEWVGAMVPADTAARTSPTSAGLLADGARGNAPKALHGILQPGQPGLGAALGGIVAIGASSGRGCAAAIGASALLLAGHRNGTGTKRTKKGGESTA